MLVLGRPLPDSLLLSRVFEMNSVQDLACRSAEDRLHLHLARPEPFVWTSLAEQALLGERLYPSSNSTWYTLEDGSTWQPNWSGKVSNSAG